MTVYGNDRMDEISVSDSTSVCELDAGKVESYAVSPEDFGLARGKKSDIAGGTAEENAKIIVDILSGKKGPKRDVVLMNSAAGLYCAGRASDLREGAEIAANLIDEGEAMKLLERYREASR